MKKTIGIFMTGISLLASIIGIVTYFQRPPREEIVDLQQSSRDEALGAIDRAPDPTDHPVWLDYKNMFRTPIELEIAMKDETTSTRMGAFRGGAKCLVQGVDLLPPLGFEQSKAELCNSVIRQLDAESSCETLDVSMIYSSRAGTLRQYGLSEPYHDVSVQLAIRRKPQCSSPERQVLKVKRRVFPELAQSDVVVDGHISEDLQRILLP